MAPRAPPRQPRGPQGTDAQRIQALALAEHGIAKDIAAAAAGLSGSQVYDVIKKAKRRGYDRSKSTILKTEYVTNDPKSGRPTVCTAEKIAEVLSLGG